MNKNYQVVITGSNEVGLGPFGPLILDTRKVDRVTADWIYDQFLVDSAVIAGRMTPNHVGNSVAPRMISGNVLWMTIIEHQSNGGAKFHREVFLYANCSLRAKPNV